MGQENDALHVQERLRHARLVVEHVQARVCQAARLQRGNHRGLVHQRAAQYRDQLERNLSGALSDDEFRPLRLQNGWYVQRYAPMLRVAVPYGEVSSAQLRVLARIAREFDRPSDELFQEAQTKQHAIGGIAAPPLSYGYAHFTTRQNLQYNWIPLEKSADVMDLLASAGNIGQMGAIVDEAAM